MKKTLLLVATLFAIASCATKSPEEAAKEKAIEEFKKNLNDPSSFELVEWAGKEDTTFKVANPEHFFKSSDEYMELYRKAIESDSFSLARRYEDSSMASIYAKTFFTDELAMSQSLKSKNLSAGSIILILDMLKSKDVVKEVVCVEENMKYRAKNKLNAIVLEETPLNWRQYMNK